MARLSIKDLVWCVLILFVSQVISQPSRTLKLVNLVYRHGDRTPVHTFPTDPNAGYFTEGSGQLTVIGKQQHYELGQYFRKRYQDFLKPSYHVDNITVQSSDVDRTLMSAQCNLAGLYPPSGSQVWNPNLLWQPIPVHTVPANLDYILQASEACPKYKLLLDKVKNSPEMIKINEENKDFYELLANKTGAKIADLFDVGRIYDALFIEKAHNLPMPEWVNELGPKIIKCQNEKFVWRTKTLELARLRGGGLLSDMVNHMKDKADGKLETKQLYMYSGHDTSISALLSALQVFNDIAPPYTATVFIELYKNFDNYSVQVSYKNSTAEPIILELPVPGCGIDCPLDLFIKYYLPVIPNNIAEECKTNSSVLSNVNFSDSATC